MNAEVNSGSCPEYEARLEDYLSGQLCGANVRELTEHLKRCVGCKAALEDAKASVRLMRFVGAAPNPGAGFARIVMARIRSGRESSRDTRGLWQPFVAFAWRFAATATLALALMVTYDVTRHERSPQPNMAAVPASEMRDLFTTDADRVPASRDEALLMVAEADHGKR
jgi:hypothetical protein